MTAVLTIAGLSLVALGVLGLAFLAFAVAGEHRQSRRDRGRGW